MGPAVVRPKGFGWTKLDPANRLYIPALVARGTACGKSRSVMCSPIGPPKIMPKWTRVSRETTPTPFAGNPMLTFSGPRLLQLETEESCPEPKGQASSRFRALRAVHSGASSTDFGNPQPVSPYGKTDPGKWMSVSRATKRGVHGIGGVYLPSRNQKENQARRSTARDVDFTAPQRSSVSRETKPQLELAHHRNHKFPQSVGP